MGYRRTIGAPLCSKGSEYFVLPAQPLAASFKIFASTDYKLMLTTTDSVVSWPKLDLYYMTGVLDAPLYYTVTRFLIDSRA